MAVVLRQWLNMCKPSPYKLYFLLGMLIGIIIGVYLMTPPTLNPMTSRPDLSYFKFENNSQYKREELEDQINNTHTNTTIQRSVSDQLYNDVKVLCWILTGPKNHKTKAQHVKVTWGKRCNDLLFMSTEADPSLPSIALPVIENRRNLWGKTKEALKYVYENYYDKADWFFKADDDTYTIMENMRYMLSHYNSSDPIYFGSRLKTITKREFMSGGSGYVLSKEALRRFVKEAIPNLKCRQRNSGPEDVEIGKCLEAVGVEARDSRDNTGRETFYPLYINDFLYPGKLKNNSWIWDMNYYPIRTGLDCCSEHLISVHYVIPENMYLMDYLLYQVVRPYGLSYNPKFEADAFVVPENRSNFKNTTDLTKHG